MRLIALLSGGKDSVLSMMLAHAHGHEVAYLANLRPREHKDNDVDSYCFQTVGHRALELLSSCLDVPLRRATIVPGQSIDQRLAYGHEGVIEGADEVETLFVLLKSIVEEAKAAGQPVTGVCSGAILSDYQRLRVEHVCGRLGLTSFAYLWRFEDLHVLDLVAQLRLDAVLIKVASMGLTPRRHLGASLTQLRPTLEKLRPHVNAAGEGGEYETLVVNCPLMKSHRLNITNTQVHMIDDNDISPTGFLDFDVDLVHRQEDSDEAALTRQVTQLIESGGLKRSLAAGHRSDVLDHVPVLPYALERPSTLVERDIPCSIPDEDSMSSAADASSTPTLLPFKYHLRGEGETTAERVRSVFAAMTEETRRSIIYTMVYLPSLDDFATLNAVYKEFFDVSPPSRAVVEIDRLQTVAVDVYFAPQVAPKRTVLHVQSISLWAAACIGPYAQANRVRSLLATAGMLGLEPSTMELSGSPNAALPLRSEATREEHFEFQFLTAVRNLGATVDVMGSSLTNVTHVQIFLTNAEFVAKLHGLWVWAAGSAAPANFRAVLVSRLPRNALVEIQAFVQSESSRSDDDDDAFAQKEASTNPFWQRPGFSAS